MRNVFRACTIAILAFVVSGSAEPSSDQVANATFNKGFSTLSGEQAFALMPQAGICHHLKFLASFRVPGGAAAAKENKMPAGAPINLWAQTYVYNGESYPGYLRKVYFAITATFTPKTGSHYIIRQDLRFPAHTLEIVDETTGRPPADLIVVKGPYCGGYM